MTIIDRDIEFYTGEAERHLDVMRRCAPSKEPAIKARFQAAVSVYEALSRYRALLNNGGSE